MLAFDCDRAGLLRDAHEQGSEDASKRFQALIERRLTGEPIAYITGRQEFWSLDFTVDDSVLIPRADTELLVERALSLIDQLPTDFGEANDVGRSVNVADLGTGSGAIAIALAHERPRCQIIATDISQQALGLAKLNAEHHAIENIEFRIGSWVEALADHKFDLLVSNPPYIAADDPHLRLGDVAYEPSQALVSGTDGLQALRSIIESAAQVLNNRGSVLLEHGYDQGLAVRGLFEANAYSNIRTHRDLAGQERMTEAQPG